MPCPYDGKFNSKVKGNVNGSQLKLAGAYSQAKTTAKTPASKAKAGGRYKCKSDCNRGGEKMSPPGQGGARPFDPALRDLRMNRPAGRFTSSAPTNQRQRRLAEAGCYKLKFTRGCREAARRRRYDECGVIVVSDDLFCLWGSLVEQGAGVVYEFGEAVGEGKDAFGLAETDGVFGN
jgi:hypothetical protein